jgi:hypothetical protein
MSDEDKKETKRKMSELELLIAEKIDLAKEIGIWSEGMPVANYKETPQQKRIDEIDRKLWELVK